MTTPPYYKHSGEFSPLLIVPGLLVSMIVSLLVAWIYAYAIFYVPFIYINALLTAGFGFALGTICLYVLKAAKVRNGTVFGIATLLTTAIAYVGHWAVWVGLVMRRAEYEVTALDVALQPGAMWETIQAINSAGAWSIFGIHFSGLLLWGVWVIEAGIIFVVSFLVAQSSFEDVPFCEKCESWCKKHADVARVWHDDAAAIMSAFENRDIPVLQSFEAVPMDLKLGNWFQCDVEMCAKCGETNTLDLSFVSARKNEKGEVSKDTKQLLSNLLLSREEAEAIRSLGAQSQPLGNTS